MAIERLYVRRATVPDLTGEDLQSNSFYALLRQRCGILLHTAERVIEAPVTSEDESAALRVPLHSPVFYFQRTSGDSGGRIIEYVASVYRGDRFRIVGDILAKCAAGASTGTGLQTVPSLSADADPAPPAVH